MNYITIQVQYLSVKAHHLYINVRIYVNKLIYICMYLTNSQN